MSDAHFLQRLTETLGPDVVATAPDDVAPWVSDWRGLYTGRAQAVIRPRTTEQVSQALALCQQAGVPVVPRGGNTGLCGGAAPDNNAANVVLSLDRMDKIRSIDTIANTMVVEAGCILGNLRRAAGDADRLFPLSLAAEDSCQIGGNLATNAGGVNVVRYGMTRELVLGVEAVLPSGEIFHGLRTLRKDNTGYDLKQLLIGSEGTLGVITAAALRLLPRADSRAVVLAAVDSPDQALKLFSLLFAQCGPRLQAFEFFTGACLDLVLKHAEGVQAPFPDRHPAYVLVEIADTASEDLLNSLLEAVIGDALECGLCQDAAVSASLAQLQSLWRLREEISESQRADGLHLKHDVSLPIEAIPAFMASMEARLLARHPGIRPFIFGHFGDGNLHYNLSRPAGADPKWALNEGKAVSEEVLEEVARYDGSISAEHGIGQLKRESFLALKDPLELRLMRAIKQVFDPSGIMNPGKLL
ncbi:FAD/FMN-containing dehydrogenase [Cupriavidus sp. YR651]|uniref:FAD-binding oxidoreductase n=1 Tax=Cupriavidus sp. YR651 TaxID=1855315 RepID=UPI0008902479|nr:FAD-binding oxidoreductase [Cupriavidus sp. YR651]SDB99080.1 FAD/FMN-containing dehydrogenase [Cupriavidus sp. YR651]